MRWSRRVRLLSAVLLLGVLQGCESSAKLNDYLETTAMAKPPGMPRRSASHAMDLQQPVNPARSSPSGNTETAFEVRGTGAFVAPSDAVVPGRTLKGKDGVMLNLVNVPVAQAAKAVLGDILKQAYTVDDKVTGTITIQTSTPIERDALSDAFEAVLKTSGAILVRNGDTLSILPAANAAVAGRDLASNGKAGGPGAAVQIIPLAHISAKDMKQILEPVVAQGAILRADEARSVIIAYGNSRDIANVAALVQTFDVDWMKGMSVGVYPVKASDPESLAADLSTVMGLDKNGPLRGVVRIIPNRRLGSVLVISSKPQHLDTARSWIAKLEATAEQSSPQLYVYKIQNRPTLELASVLKNVLSAGSADVSEPPSVVAPKFETATEAVPAAEPMIGISGQAIPSLVKPAEKTLIGSVPDEKADDAPPGSAEPPPVPPQRSARSALSAVKVTPDESKHALLIEALPREYERVLHILERIDIVSTQVMLEAVIAEVSLNDDLKFGVKWYFEAHPSHFTFSDAAAGVVASAFPGFSYFFSARSMKMAIDALSEVTDVKVVSAPSLMVMDNRKAVLQIGDQVPIITQTAQSVINPDSPIVNSVAMKDTGIILAVTPRVNDSGSVVLDVEQEVSNVTKTTSSGIDSPTIQQRRVKTTVVVADGEVIALGGLIQQRDEVNKTQIPILGNLPVVGSAFRTKDDSIKRTELVIFIRPQVARDENEARRITDEFRTRLNMSPMMETKGNDHYHRDADRILR